jgi:hypothetical protein
MGATQVARVADDAVSGAVTAGIVGTPFAALQPDAERAGEVMGGILTLGAAGGVAGGLARRAGTAADADIARMFADVQAVGGNVEAFARLPHATLDRLAAMQGVLAGKVDFVPLTGDEYRMNADIAQNGGEATAGVFLDRDANNRARVFINLDGKTATDAIAPHEIGHAILTSNVLDGQPRNDLRNLVNQQYGPDGVETRGREYIARMVDADLRQGVTGEAPTVLTEAEMKAVDGGKTMEDIVSDRAKDPAERDRLINERMEEFRQRSIDKGEDAMDWARDEIIAETFASEAPAIDFRAIRRDAMFPRLAESMLSAGGRVLEVFGANLSTTGKLMDNPSVLFRDNPLFQDRIMQKRVREYVRSYDQYLAGLEEAGAKELRGVELARSSKPEDLARSTHVKLRDEGRGVLENDFLFQKPDGTYSLKPQKIVTATENARSAQIKTLYDARKFVPVNSQEFGKRKVNGREVIGGPVLPKQFDFFTNFPKHLRPDSTTGDIGLVRKMEASREEGGSWDIDYNAIGTGASGRYRVTNLGNVRAIQRETVPYGWIVSKANHLLAASLDLNAFRASAMKAINKGDLGLFNNDMRQVEADLKTYLANHRNGMPGEMTIGQQKRDMLNGLIGTGTAVQRAANPLYSDLNPRGSIRTWRVDRLNDAKPTGRTGYFFDYDKINNNRMPSALPQAGMAMPDVPANLSTDQILRELEENQGYLGLSTLGMREGRPVKGGAQQTRELLKRNTALNEELRRRGGPQEESDVARVLRQRGQAMPDVDADYMAAVERGNMKAAQKMVDDAAERSGFNIKAFHGTPEGGFTQFKETDGGLFFSSRESIAQGYTYFRNPWLSPSERGQVYRAQLRMENPLKFDAGGARHNNIPFPEREYKRTVFGNIPEDAVSVEDAAKLAFAAGHDGVIIENVMDGVSMDNKTRSTVYAIKSPDQAKITDPIARDSAGNIIPPSKRFATGRTRGQAMPDAAVTQDGLVQAPEDAPKFKLPRRAMAQFMPDTGVDLADYADRTILALPADRMGIGSMMVGPKGGEREVSVKGQGGAGFMEIYNGGGWAFSDEATGNRFMKRLREAAEPGERSVLVGITAMSEFNHLKNQTGQLAYVEALEAAIAGKSISKKQADAHIKAISQSIMQSTAKSVTDSTRRKFAAIKNFNDFAKAVRNKSLNFADAAPYSVQIARKALPIPYKEAREIGIAFDDIGKQTADPRYADVPFGTVVALLEVPLEQAPVRSDFHYSYPFKVTGRSIGFLKKYYDVGQLTSDPRIRNSAGAVQAQPLQTVLPKLDQARKVTRGQAMPDVADAPPFYLKSSQALDAKVQGKSATPDQIKAILTNPQNGIKAEELKWTGVMQEVERLAKENNGKVPKDALLRYLAEDGAVRLEEVTLKESNTKRNIANEEELSRLGYGTEVSEDGLVIAFIDLNDPADLMSSAEMRQFGLPENAIRLAQTIERSFYGSRGAAQYGSYQLPGGENYREVVLSVPPKENLKKALRDATNRFNASDSPTERAELESQIAAIESAMGMRPQEWMSSHFQDVPNYIAHMRLNDRVDAKGKQGLFIEELQSDRHQQGREKGYRDDQAPRLKKLNRDEIEEMMALDRLGQNRTPEQRLRFIELANRDSTTTFGDGFLGVPDAPFRTSWPLQLFKRALRDAVADGKDWIGWTTGETQAARYDLSKQVSKVYWNEADGGTLTAEAIGGDQLPVQKGVTREKLPDVIGKDAAQRMIALAPDEYGDRTLKGDDLKVGGEGMKGFYDTMVPKDVAKYVKQWGAQVEKSNISQRVTAMQADIDLVRSVGMRVPKKVPATVETPIWRVNITPQMREGIKKAGQALFVGGAAAVVAEDQLEQ